MINTMKKVTSGTEYEKWCAGYLAKHHFRAIELTKATGDQGIDIIAYKHHRKYGVQCKFYDTPVGNSSVQEAYAGAAFYGCDRAAVMTNTTFTRGAAQLAEETDVLLWPQKDPAFENHFLKFYHIARLFELIVGLDLFLWVILSPALLGREPITLAAILLLLSGSIGAFTERSMVCNILTDLIDLGILSVICYLMKNDIWTSKFLWWLPNSILLLLSLLQLIQQWKVKNNIEYERSQKLLEESIQAQTDELGKKIGEILQKELHCSLELLEARRDGDTLVFQYHADQNIQAEIPTAEFAMQQYARRDGLSDSYQILDMGRRKIQVSLRRNQKEN